MQKCGKVILWFLSGHNSSKSLLPGMPQLFLFVLGQLLRGVKEATNYHCPSLWPTLPSREILLFPTIPEELSRGPGQRWAGYTAAP